MVLGALLDAGLPLDELEARARQPGDVRVRGHGRARAARRRVGDASSAWTSTPARTAPRTHPAPAATRTSIARHSHARSRTRQPCTRTPASQPAEIFELIDRSALSPAGRERAKALFQRLGEAEAAIHQMPVEKVHLHEVGALDSIIDIVGAVFALEWAGADRIVCSPLNVGGGMVHRRTACFRCRRRRR